MRNRSIKCTVTVIPKKAYRAGLGTTDFVKLIKPDLAIYRLHTDTFGLDPAHCLFIDDSDKNVLAAREAGWQSIHYVGDNRLGEALAGYDLA